MSNLLLDEYPLILLPNLATAIGLNEAIVLQQVHYWLKNNERAARDSHFIGGRWWTYNSVRQWRDQFPFWSRETIKRTLAALRKPYAPKSKRSKRLPRDPLLLTGNYNKAGFDKTIWYTIDYEALDKLTRRMGQNDPTSRATCPDPLEQNAPVDEVELTHPIPETTRDSPEINSEEILPPDSEETRTWQQISARLPLFFHPGLGPHIAQIALIGSCNGHLIVTIPNALAPTGDLLMTALDRICHRLEVENLYTLQIV